MTNDGSDRISTRPSDDQARAQRWVGWVAFAALLMILLGVVHVTLGLVALVSPESLGARSRDLLMPLDYTTWGWIQVALGLLVVVAGFLVFSGRVWARAVGVAAAVLSVLANIGFLSSHPVGAALLVAVAALLVYVLVAHGSDIRP